MANCKHVWLLMQSVDLWNEWRREKPDELPDLIRADLTGVDLTGANLERARLVEANLIGANLTGANLHKADMFNAKLSKAKLCRANLRGAYLRKAELVKANLDNANLIWANLVKANIKRATLTNCKVYGVSAWGLELDKTTTQDNLIVADPDEGEGHPGITVDDIEVAQFVYLLLDNAKIRNVIDTTTSKAVLILGRFTDERKAVLDALRDQLRKRNHLPILFDFEKPSRLDTDETITLLARMARFVIADISDAKSILQELRGIVPELPDVPVQPIILASQEEPGMFDFYRHFPWFLPVHRYDTPTQLLTELDDRVIKPALEFRATPAAS